MHGGVPSPPLSSCFLPEEGDDYLSAFLFFFFSLFVALLSCLFFSFFSSFMPLRFLSCQMSFPLLLCLHPPMLAWSESRTPMFFFAQKTYTALILIITSKKEKKGREFLFNYIWKEGNNCWIFDLLLKTMHV